MVFWALELMINAPDMLEVTEGDMVTVICSSSIPELNQLLSWRRVMAGTVSNTIFSDSVSRFKFSSFIMIHVFH